MEGEKQWRRRSLQKMLTEEEAVIEHLQLSASGAGSFCAVVQGVVPSALYSLIASSVGHANDAVPSLPLSPFCKSP